MNNAKQTFEAFEQNGSKAIDIIRKRAFTPDLEKKLKSWGVNDACEMIGRSRKTLMDAEKEGKVPQPTIDEVTKRKSYSLEDINRLRDYFGTRPSKPTKIAASVIAISNFKGGVWKTSTTIHAIQYFALKGYKCLLIDLDSQGSATQCFGYIPDRDIDDKETLLPFLLEETSTITSQIRKTYWDGLDLIPANLSLYNAEFILPVKNANLRAQGKDFNFYRLLKKGIAQINDQYDIIFIDCPPSMGMLSINAIYAANGLIIPIPPSMLDFSSTVQFFGMLFDMVDKIEDINYDFIRLLITKYEKSDNAKIFVDIIRQLYGNFVQTFVSPNSEAVKKAGTELRSIYELEKYSGSKKTLDRIINAINDVNSEIEELIIQSWKKEPDIKVALAKELSQNV